MAINKEVICPCDQAWPLRHIGTTGKSEKMLSSVIFDSMHLAFSS
jgi:hypothetical protein